MSVEAQIKIALDPFGDPVEKGWLCAEASASPPRYYTFSVSSRGDDFADDEPGCERCQITVHYFAPLAENTVARIKQTKQALHTAGFTWPSSIDASDEDGQHIVFECEDVQGVGEE